jgi:hypothetical protein
MSNKWGDVLYIDTRYRPEAGSFAKPKDMEGDRYKVGQWYFCRDLFHGQLYNCGLFFFSHDVTKGHCVAAFMRAVEEILEVYPKSDFGPTQRKTIMWVKPSRWWTVRAMRRSLFTILLRAGAEYNPNKDNFNEALFSDPYTMGTQYATQRFFAGYTVYTGKKRGWYNQFRIYAEYGVPNEKEIDKLLVKP